MLQKISTTNIIWQLFGVFGLVFPERATTVMFIWPCKK